MTKKRNGDIDLESKEYVPVGYIGCLTLTLRKKIIFEIFELTMSYPSFSRQLKINSLFYQKTEIRIAGKTEKKSG